MKPGSSNRCRHTIPAPEGKHLRCRRHIGHEGPHSARRGAGMVSW